MYGEGKPRASLSVSAPIGFVVVGIALGLAAIAAYIMKSGRKPKQVAIVPERKARGGKSAMRKFGLLTLITLIENDVTRKGVVAALKAIARRS